MAGKEETVNGVPFVEILARLCEPIPPEELAHRQDGKVVTRGMEHTARFVTYVEAGFVRQRLDEVVPGRWSLEIGESIPGVDLDDVAVIAVKASITIMDDQGREITREDYGEGKSHKAAATDAFKRAAVRWGIGHELYNLPSIWVKMDGNGKGAKALENPAQKLAQALAKRDGAEPRKTAEQPDGAKVNGKQHKQPPAYMTVDGALADIAPDAREVAEKLMEVMDLDVWTAPERQLVAAWLCQQKRSFDEIVIKLSNAAKAAEKRQQLEEATV